MKIAVYSIAKNEAAFVERFLKSCVGADLVVVADTGSTDGTQNEFTKRQAGPTPVALHRISINPWRFDTARNVALSLVPADIDVCIRLDLDEVLDAGWREHIEQAWAPGIGQLWYRFNHGPNYSFYANYIHSRHGFIWRGMDHEAIYPAIQVKSLRLPFEGSLSITHHQDITKDRSGILPRLIAQVAEDRRARTLYYLGREFFYYRMSDQCITTLKEHLAMPDSTWTEERMDARSMIAESYERLGNVSEAIKCWYQAIAECPVREPMVGLAKLMASVNNKELALGLIQQALRIPGRLTSIFTRPSCWDASPLILAASCARDLGWNEKAAKYEQMVQVCG